MNKKDRIREGDLVYIPSDVRLVQIHPDGSVLKYSTTKKPMGVILTKKHEEEFLVEADRHQQQESYWSNYCEVLYNSDRWLIHHRDIFKMREE